jgi:hypothetical protein
MKTTPDLILAYLINYLQYERDGLRVDDYTLNGSVLKITYSYLNSYNTANGVETYRDKDNCVEVEILDYITFVFNSK